MTQAIGYAAKDAQSPLAPFHFERRDLRDEDVAIEILYCGVCHSDLHQARNDWHSSMYPLVPGHEIVGTVTAVGPKVSKMAVGQKVAVGCMVDSCLSCDQCDRGMEQMCRKGATMTYNGKDRQTGDLTFGGYSDHIVVREEFVLTVPDSLDMERAAPLLCAGITTWSPLREWKVGPGSRVGVIGLGGLGHMAVKLAAGLGADVTVITTSPEKEADALKLGANRVLLSKDPEAMKKGRSSFDLIIDTVPVAHDIQPYLPLLDVESTLVLVGAIDMLPSFHSGHILGGRRRIAGSPIGGIAETQELLDFCAEKNILPECETIAIQDINGAYERMERSDVKYRFVIDLASLSADR
ncbi:NAD(P)-dependent alcohol dehydrogenase [Sphingobium sp. Sx8-8]|uniref:NAD(P)-dependent alcohol dehydrogenase n=1 Tax=Sphingobium sp. Sx8-8 TaxID=2933617 RepID=UPI001F55BE51|nr:NAD(P)-dependent alcohol dehydrogenase [Sphingobium sp. Sx8-8]